MFPSFPVDKSFRWGLYLAAGLALLACDDGSGQNPTLDLGQSDGGQRDAQPKLDTSQDDTSLTDGAPNSCEAAEDCPEDEDPCTERSCEEGICGQEPIPGCGESCETPEECPEDEDPCTERSCEEGICGQEPIPNCGESCETPEDCLDDEDPCTERSCEEGVCGQEAIPDCGGCEEDSDCPDDADPCTAPRCAAGGCFLEPIPGCGEGCEEDSDCLDDEDPCTQARCVDQLCGQEEIPECCHESVECADDNACTDDLCVENRCENPEVPNCCMADGDCGEGGSCLPNHRCAQPSAPGALVFTEIMFNPAAVGDSEGEWLEIHNTTEAEIDLNGWTLHDNSEEGFRFEAAQPQLIPPGGWFVLARNGDPEINGGILADLAFENLALGNGGDELRLLDPFGSLIDAVSYGDGWPSASGVSLSLAPEMISAEENDLPESWCLSLAPPLESGDRGSPGAANPSCVPEVEEVDWCRLQWPLELSLAAGEPFTAYVRLYEEGLTDLSEATDPSPALFVELGYGPDASDPASAEGWIWFSAYPNREWNAGEAGEPDNDEYQIELPAPAPGTYDLAFRVSADAGQSWLYCDQQAEAGDGSDGGYQIENAGSLVSEASLCSPNPCSEEPLRSCESNIVHSEIHNLCVLDVEAAEGYRCDLGAEEEEDCAELSCVDGVCQLPGTLPQPGEMIFTEVLYDPHDVLEENHAEWFEIYNLSEAVLSLHGCTVSDNSNTIDIQGVTLEPGGYALFAKSDDPALNGGLLPDHLYSFGLNSGGDILTLSCAEQIIDILDFNEDGGFPNARRVSIQLDPSAYDADANDDPDNWCEASEDYFINAENEEFNHKGSPGLPNPECPDPDLTVDWCRLDRPEEASIPAGAQFEVYGHLFEAGITDRSGTTDPDAILEGQLGFGPQGSEPNLESWTWFDARPNDEWLDDEEPGNDEYMAAFVAPAPGSYDFAYRFRRAEAEWLYCDTRGAEGDGSDGGYQIENAGQLTSLASPCEGDPCAQAPAPICAEDGLRLISYLAPGSCTVDEDQALCEFEEEQQDCSVDGGRCEQGACAAGLSWPAEGEIIFTEFLYDPHGPLADGEAEWFEIKNLADTPRSLHGCVIRDSANEEPIMGLNLEAGALALFAQSDDPTIDNGGLTPDHLFGFGLNNSGDSLSLICGEGDAELLIDNISYQDLNGRRRAYQLNPEQFDAVANDDIAAHWCLSEEIYYSVEGAEEENHFGTPGRENQACVQINRPDYCRLHSPELIDGAPEDLFEIYGILYEAGVTDLSDATDSSEQVLAELGYGLAIMDPAGWDWIAAVPDASWNAQEGGEPNNDRYVAEVPAPAVGTYAYLFRFSVDGGANWDYCDLGEGNSDGYQAEQTGQMSIQVPDDPRCNPNPCTDPPPTICDEEGLARLIYQSPGECSVVDEAPACSYSALPEPCADEEVCRRGVCVIPGIPPAEGEVIFTEFMYDPSGAIIDNDGEWFEIYNITESILDLEDCTVSDSNGVEGSISIENLRLGPGDYAIFGRSNDQEVNGGLEFHQLFEFALNNSSDTITLQCADVVVDVVAYDEAEGFPAARGNSLILDPQSWDAAANDEGSNWCRSSRPYHSNNTGSPGFLNQDCDNSIDWCRFQAPLELNSNPGADEIAFGRFYEEGVSDQTHGFDETLFIRAEFGFGPVGSVPGEGWEWFLTSPTPGWDADAAGEPDNDEFRALFVAPAVGEYDMAYRITADNGRSWTLCDGDGSQNGYDSAQAGHLLVEGLEDPCAGDPCQDLPEPSCDGNVRISYLGAECEVIEDQAVCNWLEDRWDCGEMGMGCAAGECIFGLQEGQIIFTELMPDPHTPLADVSAEWIELRSLVEIPTLLDGCILDINGNQQALDGLEIPAGEEFLMVRSDDPVLNGDLVPDALLSVSVGNSGATVSLICDEQLIDTMSYGSSTRRTAWQLHPSAYDHLSNDNAESWCLASEIYLDSVEADHRGTPRLPNTLCEGLENPCEPNPCDVPPAAECLDENTILSYAPLGDCSVVGGGHLCNYPTEEIPCPEAESCVEGACHAQGGDGVMVINEVDYDQPNDEVLEFIELLNSGTGPQNLTGWRIELINGRNGELYMTINLEGSLEPGAYLLIADATLPTPPEVQTIHPDNFSIQNGAPDGLRLLDADGAFVDGLAYEGDMDGVGEGGGVSDGDLNEEGFSLARCQGGVDTDDNATDFQRVNPPSPGLPNPVCVEENLCEPNPCTEPPPPTCADEITRRTFSAPGRCEVQEGQPVCDYNLTDEACPEWNACQEGVCVEVAPCEAYCFLALNNCTGEHAVFEEGGMLPPEIQCMMACSEIFTLGEPGQLQGDTLACRATHAYLASEDPAMHCPSAAPDGGSYCHNFGLVYPNFSAGDSQIWEGRRRGSEMGGYFLGLNTFNARADDCVIRFGETILDCIDAEGGVFCEVPPGSGWAEISFEKQGERVRYPDWFAYEPIDYCIQLSPEAQGAEGAAMNFYGHVYEAGITEAGGAAEEMEVQWGYGEFGTDPALVPAEWIFFDAHFSSQEGNNDEFEANILLPGVPGALYSQAFRVRLGDGIWTYCDANGTVNNILGSDNQFSPDDTGFLQIDE